LNALPLLGLGFIWPLVPPSCDCELLNVTLMEYRHYHQIYPGFEFTALFTFNLCDGYGHPNIGVEDKEIVTDDRVYMGWFQIYKGLYYYYIFIEYYCKLVELVSQALAIFLLDSWCSRNHWHVSPEPEPLWQLKAHG
jgi:hypothetical protein